ncbi:hypothetical protein SETIT_7G126100v2 [Setaria italica]|uniref:Dynein light chain n=2 Tax=Setaria TaxID=4554 RepID=A0A368RV60_SETIT|nr:hypothetical protein SETIT_7G126100v2 [Setaria italica]TKW04813.1 hypothetical protein SEVIR_7G134100v2 [Setaria viridis]
MHPIQTPTQAAPKQTAETSSFCGSKPTPRSQKLLPRIPGAATQNSPRPRTPTRQTPRKNPADHRSPGTDRLGISHLPPSPARSPCPLATAAVAAAECSPLVLCWVLRIRPQAAGSLTMDPASEELERRSRYLSALVRRTRLADPPQPEPEEEEVAEGKVDVVEPVLLKAAPRVLEEGKGGKEDTKAKERAAAEAKGEGKVAVCVRAADMPLPLQRRAVRIAVEAVAAMPRLQSKRLALALKKDFDTTYGPAWHCIVGTSFGSYVTHSLGGFLYFSVDKMQCKL